MKVIKGVLFAIFTPWILWGVALWCIYSITEYQYVIDFFFYVWPVIVTAGLVTYASKKEDKKLLTGIIIGTVIFYPIFIWAHLFALGDMATCERYFFNLLSSC